MRKTLCVLFLFSAVSLAVAQEQYASKQQIEDAVERMLRDYPHSTLQDIYKSFFQDRFGPAHLVADTAQAVSFLCRELMTAGDTCVMLFEPTGCYGNYVRVALAVVSNGKMTFEEYLSCFLRSVREVNAAEVEEWIAEWTQIEKVIAGMKLSLPGYEKDASEIAEMLSKGHYAVHHSKQYNEHHAPHYRIISRKIFDSEILPLLRQKQ